MPKIAQRDIAAFFGLRMTHYGVTSLRVIHILLLPVVNMPTALERAKRALVTVIAACAFKNSRCLPKIAQALFAKNRAGPLRKIVEVYMSSSETIYFS